MAYYQLVSRVIDSVLKSVNSKSFLTICLYFLSFIKRLNAILLLLDSFLVLSQHDTQLNKLKMVFKYTEYLDVLGIFLVAVLFFLLEIYLCRPRFLLIYDLAVL
jgi:hypothetical protein